jgi:hypothetical protein
VLVVGEDDEMIELHCHERSLELQRLHPPTVMHRPERDAAFISLTETVSRQPSGTAHAQSPSELEWTGWLALLGHSHGWNIAGYQFHK